MNSVSVRAVYFGGVCHTGQKVRFISYDRDANAKMFAAKAHFLWNHPNVINGNGFPFNPSRYIA